MLHVLLKRQFVTTANVDSKDLHEKSGIINIYNLAETPTLPIYIASVFIIYTMQTILKLMENGRT